MLTSLLLIGLIPLLRALHANRSSTLCYPLLWATAAWLAWSAVSYQSATTLRYLALCLTGCAAVAVLGARRPHAGVWNFVVLSLLAVMLLPLLEGMLLGSETFDLIRGVLVCGAIAIGVANYLPTRFGLAALALAIACGGEFMLFRLPQTSAEFHDRIAVFSNSFLVLTPWLAWAGWWTRRRPLLTFDAVWLDFRERFGLVWALRLREQFNRAAANAQWPVQLGWRGLHAESNPMLIEPARTATLRALVQRFV